MKKIIAILLTLLVAGVPLVGCGKGTKFPPLPDGDPIDTLSIKRGINVSTLEYSGFNKEMRVAMRGGELTKAMVEDIKAQGFDHIRLPVNFAANYSDGKVNEEFYTVVDGALDIILESGLTVILDFHGWEELKSDVGANKEKFYVIWEDVAEHYKDYPYELLFELFNEPYRKEGPDTLDADKLNEIQSEAIKIVRKTNPKRIIVVSGPEWNTWWGLKDLELPEDDRNIIVDVHTYQPMDFTSQGSELILNSGADVKKVVLHSGVFGEIDQVLRSCKEFTERTGKKVWLGEWGMVVAVPHGKDLMDFSSIEEAKEAIKSGEVEYGPVANKEDVTEYLSYVTEKMEAAGIPWAWWEYDFEYGAYDSVNGEWRDFVLDGLFRK